MSKSLASIFIVADSTGAFAALAGDYSQTPNNTPRAPDLSAQTVFFLTGENYSVEYDSTGEIYVEFLNSQYQPLSDVVLLVRGMSVQIRANIVRVVGVRRAGAVRITAGSGGGELRLTNAPSGLSENLILKYPAGVDGTNGPAGWTTVAHPSGLPGAKIAYGAPLGISAVFGGSVRRFDAGAVTATSYNDLAYGFVDVQAGAILRYHDYYVFASNAAVTGSTFGVDTQAHWRPAVIWIPTAAGIAANAATPQIYLQPITTYTFKRDPAKTFYDLT